MITTLHIKNIGIIDDLNVDFQNGFNVLTGETGAGKTLIIDSLLILAGGRFSKDMIRKGEEYSFIEINLYMPENKMSDEGNIIVSREIHQNGRNSCKINGRLVTVNELKDFMADMIDIHGQNDNQKLLNPKFHLEYLDGFIDEISQSKQEYFKLYQNVNELKRKLSQNYGDEKEKRRKLDLLNYQIDEIEKAELKEDEEKVLEEKKNRFTNAEKIAEGLENADSSLRDIAIDSVSTAIRSLEKIEEFEPKYAQKLLELKNIYYEIQELQRDLSSYQNEEDFSIEDKQQVEERLDLIFSLKRKYGNSISEILDYKDKMQEEVDRINNLDEINQKIKKEIEDTQKQMRLVSNTMHVLRKKYANILEESINKELSDLEMSSARFYVSINQTDFNENGTDDVEFYIATNLGEDKKQLAKFASGGEISRIMLAIKNVLASSDKTPVLVFDEIDTGISGKAAKVVGEKLKQIGKSHQVLCITHQPSIAAKGDHNYFLYKKEELGRTITTIKKLTENETIKEIARISNGDITETAIKHAIELRKIS